MENLFFCIDYIATTSGPTQIRKTTLINIIPLVCVSLFFTVSCCNNDFYKRLFRPAKIVSFSKLHRPFVSLRYYAIAASNSQQPTPTTRTYRHTLESCGRNDNMFVHSFVWSNEIIIIIKNTLNTKPNLFLPDTCVGIIVYFIIGKL